ncbi:hypothetical protein B0H14DRAFT_1172790 [Mycena olivaceomarginata]|nr:hypothetical protein B0H14DRAFT_1172790 [Mycena olivaceomarginata]
MRAITALTHPRRGSRRSPSWRPSRSGTCIDCCRTKRARCFEIRGLFVITPPRKGAFGTGTLRQAPRHAVLAVSDNAVFYISPSNRRPPAPPVPYPIHSPSHDSSASVRASPVDPPHPVVRRVGTRPSHAVVSSSSALARESQRAARTNRTSRRLLHSDGSISVVHSLLYGFPTYLSHFPCSITLDLSLSCIQPLMNGTSFFSSSASQEKFQDGSGGKLPKKAKGRSVLSAESCTLEVYPKSRDSAGRT